MPFQIFVAMATNSVVDLWKYKKKTSKLEIQVFIFLEWKRHLKSYVDPEICEKTFFNNVLYSAT